jgi:hypothetical protein
MMFSHLFCEGSRKPKYQADKEYCYLPTEGFNHLVMITYIIDHPRGI